MTDQKSVAVVLVTTSFPIIGDGSEAAGSFVADLVDELARNVSIRVVAPGKNNAIESLAKNIEIFRFTAPPFPLSRLRLWHPKHWWWIFKVLRGGLAATRLAATGAVAIIALWGLPSGEWARRVASKGGLPYSVWMLGSDIWTLGQIPIARCYLRRVIQKAAVAYADGYQLSEDAKIISGKQIFFLPSTRSFSKQTAPNPRSMPPYRLLFLGRWHTNKGIDSLLNALDKLDAESWNLIEHIQVSGGGPMDRFVRTKIAELRARGFPIDVGGYLNKAQAEAAVADADWIVIPSRIESIPLIFSDAVKLGRPVVATPAGDLRKLIELTSCGICAKGFDAMSIAFAISAAVHSEAGSYEAGVRKAAALFSLPAIATELVQNLIGARGE